MSKISLKHSGGNVVSLNSPTNAPGAADVAFKLPNADGSNGQAIVTDGSGNLSFANAGGGKATNLIINGAMNVAQRGTSFTASSSFPVDRFSCAYSGVDEAPTLAQVDVASGTPAYQAGFRKCLKITNGNKTSGAGTSDEMNLMYNIEAQDIHSSGWDSSSTSSYATLSFWVKSSVAQTFYGYIRSYDNTATSYAFETGSLSANTWTKVTKTFPGNSGLNINNDNGLGLQIRIFAYAGTGFTDNSTSTNAWATYTSTARTPDNVSTWYTTNDATLEFTGFQLEVGSTATDFEHKSFDQELQSCFRYCQVFDSVDGEYNRFAYANAASGSSIRVIFPLMREMRAKPSVAFSGNFQCPGVGSFDINNVIMESNTGSRKVACLQQGSVSVTSHNTYQFNANGDTSAKVTYSAEL